MLAALRRRWLGRRFTNSEFAPLFAAPPTEEWVALDLETTSLDPKRAEIVSIGALRLRGNRLLLGSALALRVEAPASLGADSVVIHGLRHQDLSDALHLEEALRQLLAFIGPRPLVGYHIDYDAQILQRACRNLWGLVLPHRRIEVSRLYHDKVTRRLEGAHVDLRLPAICSHLGLPELPAHDALADAISAALVFVRLHYGAAPAYPKV